jgi:hypothetical protein
MPDDVVSHGLSTGRLNDSMIAERLNRVAGEFLLVDAETALTLLDLADMTRDRSMAENDFNRASEALATINHFLTKLDLESDVRSEIESARDELRERVKEKWPAFRSN